jgi:hypothetical protein
MLIDFNYYFIPTTQPPERVPSVKTNLIPLLTQLCISMVGEEGIVLSTQGKDSGDGGDGQGGT